MTQKQRKEEEQRKEVKMVGLCSVASGEVTVLQKKKSVHSYTGEETAWPNKMETQPFRPYQLGMSFQP